MNEFIKIDLYGQFDDDTRHECTYPVKLTNQYSFSEETVWAKSISDPRGLYGKVCKPGTDCYVMWANQYGNYFSHITRNAQDSRGGMAMVTFFVARNKVCDGRDILASLKKLTERLIEIGDYSYSGIEEDINPARITSSFHVMPQRPVKKDAVPTEPRYGYKEYSDDAELEEVFTFIEQQEYASYDKVILVKKGDVKENVAIQHLSQGLKRYYTIVNVDDASSTPEFIPETQSFKITYKKDNCDNQTVECTAPYNTGRFYCVDGNVITLRSATEVGVEFTKTFYFSIVKKNDNTGYDENKISISVNGRLPNKANRKLILFTEKELEQNPIMLISATGQHFQPYEGNVDFREFNGNYSVIKIVMEPKISRVKVQFNFPDETNSGPVFLQMDETTKAYQDLTQKMRLYGYRAYRDYNGIHHIDIPYNPKPIRDENERGLPKWARILIPIAILLVITVIGLLMYKFDVFSAVAGIFGK